MNPTTLWILGGAGLLLLLLNTGRKKAKAQSGIEPFIEPDKVTRPVDERFFYDRDEIYKTVKDPKTLNDKLAELRSWYMQYLKRKGQKGYVVDEWIREYERIRRQEPEKYAKAVALRRERYLAEKQAVA